MIIDFLFFAPAMFDYFFEVSLLFPPKKVAHKIDPRFFWLDVMCIYIHIDIFFLEQQKWGQFLFIMFSRICNV